MAGKNLHVDIILGAKTNGFHGAMGEVNKFAQAISGISKAAQDLLKDSAETYKGYEDNMLTVQAVLNSGKESATQLADQMGKLDKAAQTWAASTIFNTTDVSKALVDAARAGWSYDQMMTGIPSVMNMAQAAGMSLAEAMEYFVPVMNATGTEFEDSSLLIDKWVQSANNAPTTVSEIGEAIQNMGAISRMFASDNEMFTLLDMLALNGTTGTQAGTALRNQISRLYAPTKIAKDAMDELGISVGELFDEGESLTSAEEALNEYGLSAYDASGNMRPLLDVYKDMAKAMNGKTEQQINEFLKTVFGTRQYAVAYTLLQSVIEGYDDLYGSIENAAGSAENAGDIMTSGLTGAMTRLSSKWEEFELQIGEKFAPTLEGAATMLGNIVDTLNGMDDAQLSALTGGLTAVAGLAPTLLAGTGAVKLVETIGAQGTAILVTVAAVGALVGYIGELNTQYQNGLFGNVELDTETINKYLDNQQTIYSVLSGMMEEGASTVEESAGKVADITGTLNEKMFSYVIGGANLTEGQISELKTLGGSISENVLLGIQGAKTSSVSFFSALFGEDSFSGREAIGLVSGYYDSLYGEAYNIGLQLRDQMTAALTDGSLDAQEQKAIQSTIQRLAQIEAQIQNTQNEAAYYTLMKKAQGVSLSSASGMLAELSEGQAAELAGVDDMFADKYGVLRASYNWAKENGYSFLYNGQMISADSISWEMLEQQFNDEWANAKNSTIAKFADANVATLMALLSGGEKNYLGMSEEDIAGELYNGGADLKTIYGFIDDFVKKSGGTEALKGVDTYHPEELASLLNFYDRYSSVYGRYIATGGDAMLQDYVAGNGEQVGIGVDMGSGKSDAAKYMSDAQSELNKGVSINVSWNGLDNRPGQSGIDPNGESASPNYGHTFAEGGRATSASIFGEAGAEWAIPEEHSDRTASLLDAARAASGFSWGELISRNGGLNDGGRGDMTINYSPVINASDAGDVESVLQRDKKNLQRMMAEMLDKFGVNNLQGAYV